MREDGVLYSTQTKDDLSLAWYDHTNWDTLPVGREVPRESSLLIGGCVLISEAVSMQEGWGGGS